MADDLENYRRQFEAIKVDAHSLLDGLADAQLVWQPSAEQWSISDCLNHLVVTGNESITHMRTAMAAAYPTRMSDKSTFRHGALGRLMVRWIDAPPKMRFRAPKAYKPVLKLPAAEIVERFFRLQDEMLAELPNARGIDLARVRVTNPVSKWLKMSLGMEFALTAAHERRHLWQAWRVRESAAFPGPS